MIAPALAVATHHTEMLPVAANSEALTSAISPGTGMPMLSTPMMTADE